jgi:CheY-like chemotaxis protein
VDDDQLHLEVVQKTLEYLGYHVEAKTSSMDALALFRTAPHRYDLVVTDMTMPAMTGDKLAMELMRIRSDIPIVLCTGYSEKALEDNAKAMGIRAFVMKPVLIAQMARAVRDALGYMGNELPVSP